MIDWLDEFYSSPETVALLEESFAPLFAEYGAAVAAVAGAEVGSTPAVTPFIQAIASTYISNYLSSSRAQMQEMLSAPDPRAAIERRLAEWAEKRPGKVAQEATVQTSNAVTQTVYKDAGVTRKRWNARGKSCPYCRRMNGKVVGIDRPFHKEGDSIEVPDSEISAKAKLNFTHEIGHPPQHQGCDCVIEADGFVAAEDSPEARAADRRQYRPAADPNATPRTDPQAYWDEMDAVATELDRSGYRSSWSGRFETDSSGRGHYDANGNNTIRMDLNASRGDGPRWHNMVHELIHGVTPGGHGGYRSSIAGGWEEGPTEGLANAIGPRVRAVLNLTSDQEAAAVRYGLSNSYGPYRDGMERIRALSGMEPEAFYGELMNTRLTDRPYLVIRTWGLDQDTVQAISNELLSPVI